MDVIIDIVPMGGQAIDNLSKTYGHLTRNSLLTRPMVLLNSHCSLEASRKQQWVSDDKGGSEACPHGVGPWRGLEGVAGGRVHPMTSVAGARRRHGHSVRTAVQRGHQGCHLRIH